MSILGRIIRSLGGKTKKVTKSPDDFNWELLECARFGLVDDLRQLLPLCDPKAVFHGGWTNACCRSVM
jgi:hypothetical protein